MGRKSQAQPVSGVQERFAFLGIYSPEKSKGRHPRKKSKIQEPPVCNQTTQYCDVTLGFNIPKAASGFCLTCIWGIPSRPTANLISTFCFSAAPPCSSRFLSSRMDPPLPPFPSWKKTGFRIHPDLILNLHSTILRCLSNLLHFWKPSFSPL